MSSPFVNQSQIAELRDEMSLDFADDQYLNIVSANLGLKRPPFGFTDATWRALVKEVALQYKQVKNKFEAILSIILGPRVTQVSAFAQSTQVGDRSAVLVGTKQFPQVGTMVIDEGLLTEETAEYIYIDRYNNTVYFKNPLIFAHDAIGVEWETGVISPVRTGDTGLAVFDPSGFQNPFIQYPVIIGRGTKYEYVDNLYSISGLPSRSITLVTGSPAGSPGASTKKGLVVDMFGLDTQANVYYLTMTDVGQLDPENGYLNGQVAGTLIASGGTTSSVSVVTALPSTSPYTGFYVVFDGNVTAALAGQIGYVKNNTVSLFNFFNTLGTAPVPGDTFRLYANFQYTRTSDADNSVLMKAELPQLKIFSANTQFNVLEPEITVAVAQVQVKGIDWAVFQSNPLNVEILLPKDFLKNDLRTASYIHAPGGTGSTTANATRSIGDTDISVASTQNFPTVGTLRHNPSSAVYTYYTAHAWTTVEALSGGTVLEVADTSLFPASGTLRLTGIGTVTYTVTDLTTLTTSALPADVPRGTAVRDEHIFKLADKLTSSIAGSDGIVYYPATTSPADTGDLWTVPDVWPGPYVWDLFAEVFAKETSPGTVIDNSGSNISMVSGPVRNAVDRLFGSTVFEIEDATAFPQNFPFQVNVGENSGNTETFEVQAVALKERTFTTVAVTSVSPGDATIQVASLSGPSGPLDTFPNGGPYRIYFLETPEVVEIIGTLTSPNRLVVSPSTPILNSHATGQHIYLLSDLMLISPGAADDHVGSIADVDRLKIYAPVSQTDLADFVRPVYETLPLSTTADFTFGGQAVFNAGDKVNLTRARLSADYTSGTTLQFSSTAAFPTTNFPFVLYINPGAGPLYEERAYVTANNTGAGQLTISHGLRFTHTAGQLCEFRPGIQENFSYTTKIGTTLTFSSGLEVDSTHYRPEFISPTAGSNFPNRNGFDFPLRIPVSIEDRIRFMVELVRAAGVEVSFIHHR